MVSVTLKLYDAQSGCERALFVRVCAQVGLSISSGMCVNFPRLDVIACIVALRGSGSGRALGCWSHSITDLRIGILTRNTACGRSLDAQVHVVRAIVACL